MKSKIMRWDIGKLLAISLLVFSGLPWRIEAAERHHLLFSRIGSPRIGLFLADKDGQNERRLLRSEGLDYNPSFSPDGKWIVFTSEREGSADIYRVHLDGTGLERLTEDPSYEDQATLSPDGHTLALVSTRHGGTANIWLLDLVTRRYSNLTKSTAGNFRPSWSPDGKWIAFSSDRDIKPGRASPSWELLQSIAIYIVHPDGSGLRRLTELGGYDGSPQWSPDGETIVFYRSTPSAAYEKAKAEIASVSLKTGQVETNCTGWGCLVSPHYLNQNEIAYVQQRGSEEGLRFSGDHKPILGSLRCPSWSPHADLMVYQRELPAKIILMPGFNLDPRFDLSVTFGQMPSFSPDGKQFAVVAARNLAIVDADGSHDHMIFSRTNARVVFPVWSPDGNQIAFGLGTFFDRPVQPGQLALICPDGSNFRTLATATEATSCGFASWSPDGKQLVYRVMGKGEQGLRILTLASGQVATLTQEYDTFPVWSPKGDRIAFCSNRNGDFDIYTVRPDGTDVRRLTDSHGNDAHAIWSPDAQWLVFSSSRRGFKDERMLTNAGPQPYGELFVMRADGTEVTQLTDNQWEDATPTWYPE